MDSDTIGSNAEEPADTPASHKHPRFPDITSPTEAGEFLNHLSADALKSHVDVSINADKSYPQRAGLRVVRGAYQLTWAGLNHLDSGWDWVALVFPVPSGKGNIRGGRYYLCAHPNHGVAWWQWADVAHYEDGSYEIGSVETVQRFIRENNGEPSSARALYFVWKPDSGCYTSTEPIENSPMTVNRGQDLWIPSLDRLRPILG